MSIYLSSYQRLSINLALMNDKLSVKTYKLFAGNDFEIAVYSIYMGFYTGRSFLCYSKVHVNVDLMRCFWLFASSIWIIIHRRQSCYEQHLREVS